MSSSFTGECLMLKILIVFHQAKCYDKRGYSDWLNWCCRYQPFLPLSEAIFGNDIAYFISLFFSKKFVFL